jgi:hypothetical protein
VRTRIGAETAGLRCDDRDAAEFKIKSEEHEVEANIARAVAGFDLTFSAASGADCARPLPTGALRG